MPGARPLLLEDIMIYETCALEDSASHHFDNVTKMHSVSVILVDTLWLHPRSATPRRSASTKHGKLAFDLSLHPDAQSFCGDSEWLDPRTNHGVVPIISERHENEEFQVCGNVI